MTSHDEHVEGAMVPIRFWYETFMPKLLAAFSTGEEATKEFERDGFVDDPDVWFAKSRNELASYGADVVEAWTQASKDPENEGSSTLDRAQKINIIKAWRLTRHYLNGIQKQREREIHVQHRTTGALTQYVAFLDVYVGRAFVENADMRLTFPYFIGPGAWLFKHTVAEIACGPDTKRSQIVIDAFKRYFKLFATMYGCPYCRGHLNQFVVLTKETDRYPIEYSLLGWNPRKTDDRINEETPGGIGRFEITLDEKLATIVDGPTLRLFIWKLHNAVNASIARTESWYHADENAVYTSRYWPNIDAEIQRAENDSKGLVDTKTVRTLLRMLKICVKLNLHRKDLHTASLDKVHDVVQSATQLISELNEHLCDSGVLQRAYSFVPGRIEDKPVPPNERDAENARTEDFTLN